MGNARKLETEMKSLLDILSDLTSESSRINRRKVTVSIFPTVHRDDLEAVSVIEPNIKNGPWIAGGACLRWYQGQPVGESDIDVFCRSKIQADQLIERIKSYGTFSVKYQSENAVTISHSNDEDYTKSWTIQIIVRRFFNSLEEVIQNFDITVCEIGTAGNEWVMGDQTAQDIREKNLRFKLPLQPDAPKRLTKYWVYGYRPIPGTVEKISDNPDSRWQFSQEEDYSNAF